MLETLQSLPLWLFLCFALLLVTLAWWQAPRIRPQLIGFGRTQKNKEHTNQTIKYWAYRLFYLFLVMVIALVVESIIWQRSTEVKTKDAEAKLVIQPLPVSYAVNRRLWQIGIKPLPTLLSIPAGKFMMGSMEDSSEQPIHEVSIPNAFLMSQHEITFEQYDYFIWQMHEAGLKKLTSGDLYDYEYPNDQGWGRDNRPVIDVSWHDAQAYVNWLSKETGQQCRLPSEAEWEYAARAGTTTKYPWGNEASHEQANYGEDDCCDGLAEGRDRWVNTSPIGSFSANAWGLEDMHGNVWEWVQDTWQDDRNYDGAPINGDAWVGGYSRVLRGGSWAHTPHALRSASRYLDGSQSGRSWDLGFRVVCSLPSVR